MFGQTLNANKIEDDEDHVQPGEGAHKTFEKAEQGVSQTFSPTLEPGGTVANTVLEFSGKADAHILILPFKCLLDV